MTHKCPLDCIDPVHDHDYDDLELQMLENDWQEHARQPRLYGTAGHALLFPECDKPLPHEHRVRLIHDERAA
jgi:hypothetical protein